VAIRFFLPEQADESVAFAYSPVVEAVLSLHVLVEPKHHPLQHAWVRRMRTLDPSLRAEIRAFTFAYANSFPDFVSPRPDHDYLSFDDELEAIHELDPTLLAFEFLRPLWDHEGKWPRDESLLERADVRKQALGRAEYHGEGGRKLARLIFEDPPELARRFRELLRRYWDAAFADEWERLEPRLAYAIEDAGRTIAEHGIFALLARMRPRLLVEPERRLARVKSPHEHDVEISPQQPLVLTPSYFVWPHVRVNCDPPFPVGLIYPPASVTEEAGPRLPSEHLVQVLRAAAHDIRLRALGLIAERPRSTQELAPLLGLSEAAVSKHLRILAEAGVLTTKRDGYYVLYSLERERLAALSSTVLAFLDGDGATTR
jgi:DNA-binding transcriptional ArsR family regulator